MFLKNCCLHKRSFKPSDPIKPRKTTHHPYIILQLLIVGVYFKFQYIIWFVGIWFLSITHPLRFHCKSHCNNSFRMIFCTLLSSSKSPTQDSSCGYSKEHFIFSPNAFLSFHKHPHKSILSLSGILFNVFFYSNQTLQLSTLSAHRGSLANSSVAWLLKRHCCNCSATNRLFPQSHVHHPSTPPQYVAVK